MADYAMVVTYAAKLTRSTEPINRPVTKFGGAPLFLQPAEWPVCKQCGQKMDFLAQIRLDEPLKMSSKYDMAYVFMCNGQYDEKERLLCRTWVAGSGANKILLQAGKGPGNATEPLGKCVYPDYSVSFDTKKEPDIDITECEDETLVEAVCDKTKIGGVPFWCQLNQTPTCPACGGPTKFVAQLDAALDGQLPADHSKWDDCHFFEFGDVGTGYLFLCAEECGEDGTAFFWNCG